MLGEPRPHRYHDTWPYFARDSPPVVGVIETRPGIAPSPAHWPRSCARDREKVSAIVREAPRAAPDATSSHHAPGQGRILASSVGAGAEARDYLSLID